MSPEGLALMAEMYANNELNAEAIMDHVRAQTMQRPNVCDTADSPDKTQDALAAPAVPYTDQLACARRELRLRQQQYPVWVRQGKMTQAWCDLQLTHQAAIIATLERLVALYEPPAQETLL